jgi:hypothetical protein
MSDATRQAYLDYTGLTTLADPDVEWEDRGVESAATTIAWGLLEIPILVDDPVSVVTGGSSSPRAVSRETPACCVADDTLPDFCRGGSA